MSSVQSWEPCPKCGGVMFVDYSYHTGEGYKFCNRCGMSQELTIERDENGVEKHDESGQPIVKYSESGGYRIAYVEGGECPLGRYYTFTEPLSEQEKEKFLKYIEEKKAEKRSYLVTFDPDTSKLTQVFGKMPPDFYDTEAEEFFI